MYVYRDSRQLHYALLTWFAKHYRANIAKWMMQCVSNSTTKIQRVAAGGKLTDIHISKAKQFKAQIRNYILLSDKILVSDIWEHQTIIQYINVYQVFMFHVPSSIFEGTYALSQLSSNDASDRISI